MVAVRERAAQSWPDIATAIVRLIDNLEPGNRPRAIAFIAAFQEFWAQLQDPTRMALQQTVNNADPGALTDYRILAGVNVAHFRDPPLAVIAGLDRNGVAQAIAMQPLAEFWPRAIDLYEGSGSFRGSELNFRDLISPFAGRMSSEQHDQLLNAVIENGQNWDAADTASMLLGVLRNASPGDSPTRDARSRIINVGCNGSSFLLQFQA